MVGKGITADAHDARPTLPSSNKRLAADARDARSPGRHRQNSFSWLPALLHVSCRKDPG